MVNKDTSLDVHTVEDRFNEPQYNEFLGITNKNYSKIYGTETLYNEPRFNEILFITNTIHKRKRKIYLDITSKCKYVIKGECQTDQQGKILCLQ